MEVTTIFGIDEVATVSLGKKSSQLSGERTKEFHKSAKLKSNQRQLDCATNCSATVHFE